MKTTALLAALASASSGTQAAIEWTAGGWHTIAAYAEENQLIARALASEANYASDVTKRLCVDRTFALQENIVEGVSRQLSYYSWGCEMASAGGQCATADPRGDTCTSYDISVLVDLQTNGVRVLGISKHGAVGGGDRGTPPSLIPTTRPPSTPVSSGETTTTTPASTPTTTTPATTMPSPTTPTPTVATVAVTETTEADSSTSASQGSQSDEESTLTTTKPAVVPATAKPTPAPTKSHASSRTVACAIVSLAAVAASLL